MITIDGKWIPEGLNSNDPSRIKTSDELSELIDEIGFLPLFKNSVPGFSVEERSGADGWWSGMDEDPWAWREVIAGEGRIAYGKLFGNRAGFISREWYPIFASYRRDGYDFDSRYEDGLASHRAKKIMDVMNLCDALPSNELKVAAGFSKGGEKGFEGVLTQLQMQTYLVVRCFCRRVNKKNVEYGWPVANYSISERLFGEEHVRSAYHISPEEAKQKIIQRVKEYSPKADLSEIEKVIR